MEAIDKSCNDLYQFKFFRDIPLELCRNDMLCRSGLAGPNRCPSSALIAEFDSIEREVLSGGFFHTAAVIRLVKVTQITLEEVVLDGSQRLTGSLWFRKARTATHIGLAISTIGKELEQRASATGKDEMLRRIILDGIGSAGAEALRDEVINLFSPIAATLGLAVGSPLLFGMPGLPLTNLSKLFELLPAEKIGVQLTSGFTMLPQKTCAFVVGIGRNMKTWSRAEGCRRCGLNTKCRYRKNA